MQRCKSTPGPGPDPTPDSSLDPDPGPNREAFEASLLQMTEESEALSAENEVLVWSA